MNIDLNSIIAFAIIATLAYFVIKFIVSPLIKIISGIVIILIAAFAAQKYLGINISQYLGPLGQYFSMAVDFIDSLGKQISVFNK